MADKKSFYEVLGVTQESTDREITKAYRKKALICHPDKNPDDPKAAAIFHELTKAFEALTDPKARAALDASLKAKERQRLRTQALDAKRKKFKLDLEQQESAAKESTEAVEKRLKAEIERLREEGSQLLKDQQDMMRTQNKEKIQTQQFAQYDHTPKLKVKWKCKKNDDSNGGYSQELLTKLFQKYGEITHVIVSRQKKGSAIVEFSCVKSAKMALMNEFGSTDNPLNISWLEDPAQQSSTNTTTATPVEAPSTLPTMPTSYTSTDRDYESITLMRLRQAQERKRLIEEMQNEDD